MRVVRLPDRRGFPYKKDQKEIRFSFVVSKKATKLAVVRNKLCRIGYDTIRENISDIDKSCLAAIFIKKGAVDLSKKELEKEIISLFQKANLLKTKEKDAQKNSH